VNLPNLYFIFSLSGRVMVINDKMALHTEKPSATNGDVTTLDITVKAGLAQMLKGGVIMDVVNAEQVRTPPSSLNVSYSSLLTR
jgi:SOR/SNZ family